LGHLNTMNQAVISYYNEIATEYDESRFGNSYGRFIDVQERAILKRFLGSMRKEAVLDMGCGTGRLLDFAGLGVDGSEEMLSIAKHKHPMKQLFHENALNTHFEDATFEAILSFHVVMHIEKDSFLKLLDEVHRVLKDQGSFIFDVPSAKRRRLVGHKHAGWHGSQAYTKKEILACCGTQWRIKRTQGVMILPIHRIPTFLRRPLCAVDRLWCRSFIKDYSSYVVYELIKK
jgi:ubiquinone/menaquinone biosynthesis C-methylase UbiE